MREKEQKESLTSLMTERRKTQISGAEEGIFLLILS